MTKQEYSDIKINFKNAALIIIDMQNDFLLDDAPIRCPYGLEIVSPINELAKKFRSYHCPVIYTKEAHRQQKIDFGLELDYEEPEHCLENSKGVEFFEEITPHKNDIIIKKRRYSAFFATDLDLVLKGLNVDTLILTGVATDVCVRATAQDAQQYNYRVIVPHECVAGTSAKAHNDALDNISYIFGKVVPYQCILNQIDSI